VGTEVRFSDFLELDTSFYFNSYRDLVVQGRVTETEGRVEAEEAYDNDGEGRSWGLEVLLRHRPHGRLFGWVAYTLAKSERRRDGEPWARFGLDQTHILTAVASVDLGAGWTAGARFQLVTGIPRTPIVGSVYDGDTNSWKPVLGEVNSARQPAFHQLDLRVDKLFLLDTFKLTAYLDLQNVYNRANSEFTVYNHDFSESATVAGIPVLPSLGVKAEF